MMMLYRNFKRTPICCMPLLQIRSKANNKLIGSSRRYTTSIALLKSILKSPAVFHPSLIFANGLVHVHMDVADLSASPAAHCVAISNRSPSKFFVGPSVRD